MRSRILPALLSSQNLWRFARLQIFVLSFVKQELKAAMFAGDTH